MENVKLKIFNDYSFLHCENIDISNFIWEKFRFRKKGYFHSRLYKQRLWDGFIDFFDKKNGKFLTGLLPEMQYILKYLKINYNTEDLRGDLDLFDLDSIDNQFLNKECPEGIDQFILEDYQVDFVNSILKHKRGIVQSPTASGKTAILLSMIKALKNKIPVLFLGNMKGIVHQNYLEMTKWKIPNIGKFDSTCHKPNLITCASVQSLHHLDKLLPKFKVLVVDEAHTMMSNTCIKAYKKLKDCRIRIAFSATPFKHGGKDLVHKFSLKGFFGPVLKTKVTDSGILTTDFLKQRGRLSNSICHFYYINEPQIPYDVYIDAITNGIEKNFNFHQIVKRLTESLTGRTLILVSRVSHGEYLQQLLPNAKWIYGKDSIEERQNVINKLQKEKNFIGIATTGIFNAGINVFVHNLINAASGQADHEIIQRFGRGLRTANDKEILKYYDFIFTINPYLEKHSKERIKILTKEKHEIIIHEEMDF